MEHENRKSVKHVYDRNDRMSVLLERVQELRKHGESCGGGIQRECEQDVDCLEQMMEEQTSEACMYKGAQTK